MNQELDVEMDLKYSI